MSKVINHSCRTQRFSFQAIQKTLYNSKEWGLDLKVQCYSSNKITTWKVSLIKSSNFLSKQHRISKQSLRIHQQQEEEEELILQRRFSEIISMVQLLHHLHLEHRFRRQKIVHWTFDSKSSSWLLSFSLWIALSKKKSQLKDPMSWSSTQAHSLKATFQM